MGGHRQRVAAEHGGQFEILQRRVSRRGLLKGAALLSAGPVFLASAKAPAAAPKGPRWISFGDDPQTSMTVSTSIARRFKSAVVEYGIDGTDGSSMPLHVKGVPGVATRYGSARRVRLERSVPVAASPAGGNDARLYLEEGLGAAAVAAIGGVAYATYRRRSERA